MNRHFYKIFLIFSLIISSGKNFYSQNPAACNNTQNLCTNALFSFSTTSGTGLLPGLNISNPIGNPQSVNAGCMFTNGNNPQWLLLNVTTTGNLGFSFGAFGSAFPQAGNYDWIMWPYTPSTCADIFNNTIPPVACNWNCSGGGGTGMGTVPVGGSPCNFQPSIPVIQGQQYLILITNPSGVNTNVSFAITGSAAISCNPLKYPNLTACPGQLAVFTGTYVNASAAIYTLFPGAIVQTNPSFTVSSLVNQVYTVQAQGLNSSAIPIADQTTFTLTINPVIPLTINTPTNFCYGSNAHFTINPTGAGSFSVSGPASPTSTFANTSISIPNITTPNIGTFSVVASYTNGCTGTQTTQVNVAPNNSITVSSNTNVCMNGTVNLTSSMPTAATYAWTGPGAYSSGLQNPTLPAIQPASSGIYTVSSNINFNGIACPKTNTTQISVVTTNTVAVTPNFTLCQGTNLNLTSSAPSAFSYSWSGPSSYTSTLQNPTINSILPASSGNYTATAFFSSNNYTCNTTAVTNISVIATLPLTVTATNSNICIFQSTTLTASGAVNYTWTPPATLNSTNGTTVSANPLATTVYSITGADGHGCLETNTITLVVNPLPIITVSNNTMCLGTSALLTANGAVGYTWTPSSSLTNPNNFSVTATPSVNTTYTITGVDSEGCINSTTASVLVNSLPVLTISDHTICNGNSTSIAVSGANNYTWLPATALSSTSSANVISNPLQTITYTVIGMNLNGCKQTTISTVVVNQLPQIVITSPTVICLGQSIIINVNGALTYTWNNASITPSITVNPIVPTSYTVAGVDENGCINTETVLLNVIIQPTLSITGSPTVCLGKALTLTASGGFNYSWNTGGTSNVVTIVPQANTIYTVNSGTAPCISSTVFAVTVYTPQAQSTSANPTNIIYGASSVIQANIQTGNPFTWLYSSDINCNTCATNTVSPSETTIYTVTSTDNNGCVVTGTVLVQVEKICGDAFVPSAFSPNGDGFNDFWCAYGNCIATMNLQLYNRWGEKVFESNDKNTCWDGTYNGVMQNDAVFIYQLTAKFVNGEKIVKKGNVTLKR